MQQGGARGNMQTGGASSCSARRQRGQRLLSCLQPQVTLVVGGLGLDKPVGQSGAAAGPG